MKEYNVTVEKEITIIVLNEKKLLEMYQDSVESGNIEDAVEYVAQCILSDMKFAGLVCIEKNNGIFDWDYNYFNNKAYIN
jgi:hypothetical protein